MRHLLSVLFALVVAGCATSPPRATSVTVRDSNFNVIKELSAAEVTEFDRFWRGKSLLSSSTAARTRPLGRHYKLDIRFGDRGARWLYDTSGEVQMLSVKMVPCYVVKDREAFNRLIGDRR
jgi:hypothetical protein